MSVAVERGKVTQAMNIDRRTLLRYGSTTGLATIAGCSSQGTQDTTTTSGDSTTTTQNLTKMNTVVPEGSLYVIPFLYGTINGAWKQHGIELKVSVGPFGKFQRQVIANLAKVGGTPLTTAVKHRNQGEDLTLIGPGMTFANFMLASSDSDISSPEDIKGKKLGVPFETSTTTVGYQALMKDAYDMDLFEAPSDVRAAAPPVLWNLLNQGELDVILEFSGFSIKGQLSDDVNVVFNPIDYWKKEYGTVPPLTARTVRTSWLEESSDNADLALRWNAGWKTALKIFRENVDDAIGRFGRLAGLESEEQSQVIIDRMEREVQFSIPPYTEEKANSNWKFVKALKESGAFESIPNRDNFITLTSELEEMAGR